MNPSQWSLQRFWILLYIIAAAGLTQGMLIPTLTTLLEEKGFSSSINGLSSSGLYFGILVMTVFSPQIVKRFGYQTTIILGIGITIVSIACIPIFPNIWLWTVLRFGVGIGDSLLHYTTQLWITSHAPKEKSGRFISQYGFAYGLGFSLGPLGLNLLSSGITVPIYILVIILMAALFLSIRFDQRKILIEQEKKEQEKGQISKVYRWGFVALCPAFIYGIVETVVTSGLPVYGLREGMSKSTISLLITTFTWSGLLLQIPLGMIADRVGRLKVFFILSTIGTIGTMLIPWVNGYPWLFILLFAILGGMLGSFFSMGLAFLIDILPRNYLPTANAIAAIHFSLGSIIGPYGGGLAIQYISTGSLFYMVAIILFIFLILLTLYHILGLKQRKSR
jgi:MFS family permease